MGAWISEIYSKGEPFLVSMSKELCCYESLASVIYPWLLPTMNNCLLLLSWVLWAWLCLGTPNWKNADSFFPFPLCLPPDEFTCCCCCYASDEWIYPVSAACIAYNKFLRLELLLNWIPPFYSCAWINCRALKSSGPSYVSRALSKAASPFSTLLMKSKFALVST